jgi:hypothetical protein
MGVPLTNAKMDVHNSDFELQFGQSGRNISVYTKRSQQCFVQVWRGFAGVMGGQVVMFTDAGFYSPAFNTRHTMQAPSSSQQGEGLKVKILFSNWTLRV